MASADLGPLGAKTGLPTAYTWTMPSMAPQLLPWLAVLGLLALKPNRKAAAWLIWLPLILVTVLTSLSWNLGESGDSLLENMAALGFGLAAVWLLSSYLRKSHRLITFILMLLALAGFAALPFVVNQRNNGAIGEWLGWGLILGVGALTTAIALTIAGWLCRRRLAPIRLCLGLLVSLLVLWLAIAFPVFIIQAMARVAWTELLIPVAIVAGVNFALLLPFLILSSTNAFYRERLKFLLHVQPPAPPNLIPTVPQEAAAKA